MSAPRFVNTSDGTCWTRREESRGGEALYAPEKCGVCPEFVMATYAELEAHGVVGTANVLPVPVGPQPSERERLRLALIEALSNAHKTHPCPVLGDQIWSGCVHYDDAGRITGVGSCHSERRADAVLAVRDVELDRLRARVAELEADLATANGTLDDVAKARRAETCPCPPEGRPHQVGCPQAEVPASERPVNELTATFAPVAALREVLDGEHWSTVHHDYKGPGRDLPELGGASVSPTSCQACGSAPESWCPDCAACQKGCFGGFDANPCEHPNAPWGAPR